MSEGQIGFLLPDPPLGASRLITRYLSALNHHAADTLGPAKRGRAAIGIRSDKKSQYRLDLNNTGLQGRSNRDRRVHRKRAQVVASMVKGDEATAACLEGLEQMLAFAKEQLDKTEKDRDAWRSQAEAAQRLLIDARPRRSWWQWGSEKD